MGYTEDIWCVPETALPLSAYCKRLTISELDFWGVYRGTTMDPPSRYWLGTERRMLAETIDVAAGLMGEYMNVHLVPTWTDKPEEKQWAGNPHQLGWSRFIVGGQRATSTYQAAAAIDYVTVPDYGIVTVAHGGVGQASEVQAWYDDTQYPIEYGAITFGAADIVLQFPKQRLVCPVAMATRVNDNRGLAWELATNFLTTLTVGRVYNDPSVNAKFVSKGCNCDCGSTCQRCSQDGCIVSSVPQVGTVNIYPGSYDDGWARASCLISTPDTVQCYYQSGLSSLPANLKDALIRLTHSLMPSMACPVSREPQHSFWKRDVEIREIGAREYLNCPWGNKSGAWWAWNIASNHPENYGKSGGYL